uniref:hypothetical protein n=1 Tax=Gemmiger formicilis TaxID=745368 RepID=UPI00402938D0
RLRHDNCVAKMLDNTQSIICAFGLAAAAPRSPYRHLELCCIAFRKMEFCYEKDFIRLPRQHLPQSDGGVCDEGYGR